MTKKFTKENYKNIQRKFESETGVTLDREPNHTGVSMSVKTVIICVCLASAFASVFATDAGQAVIEKIFFGKPVESENISAGYEEPSITNITDDETGENIEFRVPGHNGIDIVCEKGTPVYPVLAGTVMEAGYKSNYGYCIVIQHEDGYTSRYAHLESIVTEVGQEVSINTQIGTVGSTGVSTGPHLHLEMTHNGELIDPSPYIFNTDSNTLSEE